jgi:hypothetical protein
MADVQQIQDAERFKKLLERSDGATKSILLNGGSIEVAQALGGNLSETEISRIIGDRNAYFLVESEVVAKVENKKTEKDKLDQSTNRTSRSIGGIITAAPVGIYSYFFSNPDRYSAKQLEKKANEYAKRKVKIAGNKVTLGGNEYSSTYTKSQQEYYDLFAKNHRRAADRIFAKSPNGYLMRAIAKDNAAKEAKIANIISKVPFIDKSSIPTATPTPAPKIANFLKRVSSIPALNRPVVSGGVSAPIRSRISSLRRNRSMPLGKGASNPLGKMPNPLSLLKRFGPTSAIMGGVIGLMFITMILTLLLGLGVAPVVGGTGMGGASGTAPFCTGGSVTPADTSNFDDYFTVTNATAAEKQKIYNYLAIPMASSTFKKLVTKGGQKTNIDVWNDPAAPKKCIGAVTNDGYHMTLKGFFNCNSGDQQWFIVHEFGHIIDGRNSGLNFNLNTLRAADSSCYNSHGYLISYPWDSPAAASARDESFAEAIAQYVIHDSEASRTRSYIDGAVRIPNYSTTCPSTYAWAGNNIFDNINFSAGACTGSVGGSVPPNSDTCGGAYNFSKYPYTDPSFEHQDAPNFGDPECKMVGTAGLDLFYTELKRMLNGATTTDGAGKVWDDWVLFNIIIKHESGYDPNAFLIAAIATNHVGAYGLFQMAPASLGDQGWYNVGDVNWPVQIYNAAMYNYRRTCKFGYWSTTHWWATDPKIGIPWTSISCATGNKAQPVQ